MGFGVESVLIIIIIIIIIPRGLMDIENGGDGLQVTHT